MDTGTFPRPAGRNAGIIPFVLILAWACVSSAAIAAAGGPPPAGADAPGNSSERGASLFDRLFATQTAAGTAYDVPYPFERLLARLRERLPGARMERARPFATVLIPRGRSLHRDAARPEFFRYPRIVVAVDVQSGERIPTRDRLFLGYQERARQIEIISFNEAAGRFEFQVVSDYAPGRDPVVRHASRPLCTSCHQNGGAIFPRPPWSETNADPLVAQRIHGHHRSAYRGVSTDRVSADAGLTDSSTNRANLLPVYQRLWRDGCESPDDPPASLRCRADAFHAMVRFRLGVWSHGLPGATTPHAAYRRVLAANWRKRWPDGLVVPEADLPDRRPALDASPTAVTPPVDPLTPRPPRGRWTPERSMDRAIEGLARTFLLKADIEHLDRALARLSPEGDGTGTRHAGDCKVERTPFAGTGAAAWIDFECTRADEDGKGVEVMAELVTDGSGRLHGKLSWVFITNGTSTVYATPAGTIERSSTGRAAARLSLRRRHDTIRARLGDGAAVTGIEFEWDTGSTADTPTPAATGRFALTLSRDLERLDEAIAGMLADAEAGEFDGFGKGAFRGVPMMDALFRELGVALPAVPDLPRVTHAEATAAGRDHDGDTGPGSVHARQVELFRRHCGACHASAAPSPPGFLAGDTAGILGNLRACAERISFRLAMWNTPAQARSRTPMPPATRLSAAAISPDEWTSSEEYLALRHYADALRDAADGDLLSREYDDLPPCLPGDTARQENAAPGAIDASVIGAMPVTLSP